MRSGYTTGTCAAAAARAAVMLLFGAVGLENVDVATPSGKVFSLPLAVSETEPGRARAAVRKDAGDDPDVTHGALIVAEAVPLSDGRVTLDGGRGVGRVTKPGLALPVGEAAINPVPRRQITDAIESVLPAGKGVSVTISVPEGETLAKRTLNPALGIVGGISILGTTGIVEPMSNDAFKRSLVPQIDVALAAGCSRLILTPGKMGKRNALKRFALSEDAVVITSNFIGYMLTACADKGVTDVLMLGHIGKLMKVAAGITNTHSAVADARREILVAHGALCGLPHQALLQLMAHNTAEESAAYLREEGYAAVLESVADAAARRAEMMTRGRLRAGCVLLNLAGDVLAEDQNATRWLEELK
ncbi:MAG: cobalt-precorrin-5B (C(1))-methyltransferase CbiD [Bacillota bacterium]|nr:cobalt-precorrin-5B (C(1))-methyltransferase CbiD [Bacillota bacterium]